MDTIRRALRTFLDGLWQATPIVFVALLALGVSLFFLFGWPRAWDSGHPKAWQLVFNLAAFLLFLAVMLAFVAIAHHEFDNNNAFVAGMVATGALIPTTVTEISTLAAYVVPQACFVHKTALTSQPCIGTPILSPWVVWVHNLALLIGVVAGLVSWLIWGFFFRHLAGAPRQNAPIYARLRQRYIDLGTSFLSTHEPTSEAGQAAYKLVDRSMNALEDELGLDKGRGNNLGRIAAQRGTPGLRWVLATGYLSLWTSLHCAEEALMMIVSRSEVVRSALYDLHRLQGSKVPDADQLQSMLRRALSVLSPTYHWPVNQLSGGYMSPPGVAQTPPQAGMQSSWDPYGQASPPSEPVGWPIGSPPLSVADAFESPPSAAGADVTESDWEVQDARTAVRDVRRTINEFRDLLWGSLVRRRNHLLEAVVFTRVTAYSLLGFAILIGVAQAQIIAVAVFYLVGAVVGLLKQLSSTAGSSQAVEDYGLSSAILTQTTPFSGLAAVGGVLVVGLLGSVGHQGGSGAIVSDLASIFDLGKDQFGIVIAAVFGLTPSLLLGQLQRISHEEKLDLQSASTSDTGSTSSAGSSTSRR